MRREIIRKRIAAQKAAEEAEQKAAEQANRDREDAELDKLTEEMGRAAIDRCIMIMQKACMCNVYREKERDALRPQHALADAGTHMYTRLHMNTQLYSTSSLHTSAHAAQSSDGDGTTNPYECGGSLEVDAYVSRPNVGGGGGWGRWEGGGVGKEG